MHIYFYKKHVSKFSFKDVFAVSAANDFVSYDQRVDTDHHGGFPTLKRAPLCWSSQTQQLVRYTLEPI